MMPIFSHLLCLIFLIHFQWLGENFNISSRYNFNTQRSCDELLGTPLFATLAGAEMVCNENPKCGGVYDNTCTQNGIFHLCAHKKTWTITTGCIFEKLPVTGPVQLCPGDNSQRSCENTLMPTAKESTVCTSPCQKWKNHFWCCTQVDDCLHGKEVALSWGWCIESSAFDCAGNICGDWGICIENECACISGYRRDHHLNECVQDHNMINVDLLPKNITADSIDLVFFFTLTTTGDTDMTCELLAGPKYDYFEFASAVHRLEGVLTDEFYPFRMTMSNSVHLGMKLLLHCFFNTPEKPGYGNQTTEETVKMYVLGGHELKDIVDVSHFPNEIEIFPTTASLIVILEISTKGSRDVHIDLIQNGILSAKYLHSISHPTSTQVILCNLTVLHSLQSGMVEFNSYLTPRNENYTRAIIFGPRVYTVLSTSHFSNSSPSISETFISTSIAASNFSNPSIPSPSILSPSISSPSISSNRHKSESGTSSQVSQSPTNRTKSTKRNPKPSKYLILSLIILCLIGSVIMAHCYKRGKKENSIVDPLLKNGDIIVTK